jgi:hypothetical protein
MKAKRLPLEVEIKEVPFDCVVKVGDGIQRASKGDFLITNILGETYPVRRDVFMAQYEISEMEIALDLLNQAMVNVQTYTNSQVRDKMVEHVLAEVPDLAFYFKAESINAALTDTVQKAFDLVALEFFKGQIVNLIDEKV